MLKTIREALANCTKSPSMAPAVHQLVEPGNAFSLREALSLLTAVPSTFSVFALVDGLCGIGAFAGSSTSPAGPQYVADSIPTIRSILLSCSAVNASAAALKPLLLSGEPFSLRYALSVIAPVPVVFSVRDTLKIFCSQFYEVDQAPAFGMYAAKNVAPGCFAKKDKPNAIPNAEEVAGGLYGGMWFFGERNHNAQFYAYIGGDKFPDAHIDYFIDFYKLTKEDKKGGPLAGLTAPPDSGDFDNDPDRVDQMRLALVVAHGYCTVWNYKDIGGKGSLKSALSDVRELFDHSAAFPDPAKIDWDKQYHFRCFLKKGPWTDFCCWSTRVATFGEIDPATLQGPPDGIGPGKLRYLILACCHSVQVPVAAKVWEQVLSRDGMLPGLHMVIGYSGRSFAAPAWVAGLDTVQLGELIVTDIPLQTAWDICVADQAFDDTPAIVTWGISKQDALLRLFNETMWGICMPACGYRMLALYPAPVTHSVQWYREEGAGPDRWSFDAIDS